MWLSDVTEGPTSLLVLHALDVSEKLFMINSVVNFFLVIQMSAVHTFPVLLVLLVHSSVGKQTLWSQQLCYKSVTLL